MKKLLFVLLFGLFAGMAFSQTFLRAHRLTIGTREEGKVVEWGEERITNVLIIVDEDKVEIHSNKKQVYRIINELENINTNKEHSIKWKVVDSESRVCHLFLLNLPTSPEIISVGVVYKDMVWYYLARIN